MEDQQNFPIPIKMMMVKSQTQKRLETVAFIINTCTFEFPFGVAVESYCFREFLKSAIKPRSLPEPTRNIFVYSDSFQKSSAPMNS